MVKTARELYPDIDDEHMPMWDSTYEPIIQSFGQVAVQVDDDEYSGDSRILYENPFGLLIFGWGSCSGCDALRSCDTWDDADKLIQELYDSIIWFEDAQHALAYFNNHDWEGDYSYGDKEMFEFREKAVAYLEGIT